MTWLLVGFGGAVGSVARHGLNQVIQQRNLVEAFPFGIFVVNVLGSAVIGGIAGLIETGHWPASNETKAFVIVGLLGGFTTFSSFSLDTLSLVRHGLHAQAAWNVVGQVGLSLLGVWAGYRLAS